MFLDSRFLFFVGATLVGSLMAALYSRAPMPAKITGTHAAVIAAGTLESCAACHHEEGLNVGCMECHQEIGTQLRDGEGYHSFLSQSEDFQCAECHSEHLGMDYPLVNDLSWGGKRPETFSHPHIAFGLEGVHSTLACEQCHVEKREGPFHMADFPQIPRDHTFLGLSQDCRRCHEDPHTEGMTSVCGECHGQEVFNPPQNFDHDQFLPLVGKHDGLECSSCHIFNFPQMDRETADTMPHPFPFNQVQGTTCGECHVSPHRAEFGEGCHECHEVSDEIWTVASGKMNDERHQRTGFHLVYPHNEVSCEQCHTPGLEFDERHPNPNDPGYLRKHATCQGCHEDPHQGQFEERHSRCLDCHTKHAFTPTRFGPRRHAERYPLTGAHGGTSCVECHQQDEQSGVRRFSGTTTSCKDCHESPHGTQFRSQISKADCRACHNDIADTFSISPFDHLQWTGYALKGAHTRAECVDCHRKVNYEVGDETVSAHRYERTPTECAGCHTDVHRGQFSHRESCADCHSSQSDWYEIGFDHNTMSRFPLEGAHLEVECSSCHRPTQVEGQSSFTQYRPLGRDCRDCHEIDPRTIQKR